MPAFQLFGSMRAFRGQGGVEQVVKIIAREKVAESAAASVAQFEVFVETVKLPLSLLVEDDFCHGQALTSPPGWLLSIS